MPNEIKYHPGPGWPNHYVIETRCPEHRYSPMRFDPDFAVPVTKHPGFIKIHLHCPICSAAHTITITTAS